MRVLIVEDSPIVQERLIHLIGKSGNASVVATVSTPHAAKAVVEEAAPDLVIMDLVLRGGSGLEVLKHIVEGGYPSTVAVLTNYTFEQYRRKCLQGGAKYFLDKSTEFDRIPAIIDECCRTLVNPALVTQPSSVTG